ncbi:MAG TPA: hypothetical protein V6C81_16245 [Planktothrix sp.]|jgi:hypothetical protein
MATVPFEGDAGVATASAGAAEAARAAAKLFDDSHPAPPQSKGTTDTTSTQVQDHAGNRNSKDLTTSLLLKYLKRNDADADPGWNSHVAIEPRSDWLQRFITQHHPEESTAAVLRRAGRVFDLRSNEPEFLHSGEMVERSEHNTLVVLNSKVAVNIDDNGHYSVKGPAGTTVAVEAVSNYDGSTTLYFPNSGEKIKFDDNGRLEEVGKNDDVTSFPDVQILPQYHIPDSSILPYYPKPEWEKLLTRRPSLEKNMFHERIPPGAVAGL